MKAKSLSIFVMTVVVMLAADAARAQVTNFFQAVTNLNPAAYWPLQETAQPPQADLETNLGSIGAVANAYYSSTNAAKAAQGIGSGFVALSCVGTTNSGSFLAVPNTSPLISVPVGPFSVECWIYPSNVNNNVAIAAQAGLTTTPGLNGSASGAGWSLNQNFDPYTGQNTPGWSFHVYNGVGVNGGADALVVTNYATNTWYHIVGVFDGTNATLYVNGIAATTVSIPMPAGTSYVPDYWDFVTIGCGRGLNVNPYSGEIEEVAVYTNALTQAQITVDFNAAGGSSSSYASTILSDRPYMYWRMDSPANNIAQPISAYPVAVNYGLVGNLNGLYSSASMPGMPGPAYAGMTNGFNVSGLACAFNGMGDDSTNLVTIYTNGVASAAQTINAGVLITNLALPLYVVSNSFSYCYWVKCNPMDDRRNGVFGHSDSHWRSSLLANQAVVNSGRGDLAASINMNDGNWHFVACVYTNTAITPAGGFGFYGTNYVYVDGVLKNTSSTTNALSGSSSTNILIGGAPDKDAYGNNGYIGSSSATGEPGSQMLLGSVAHVAFFTNALTAVQIQSLYNAAGAPPLIQTQPSPTSFVNNAGTTNVFGKVTASGASTLAYQWYYSSTTSYSGATALTDGQTVSGSGRFGSATAQLTLTNLGSADVGYYFVVITNNYGSVTSVLSQEQVIQGPIISAQNPTGSFSAYVGQNNLLLSVTALGSGLSYQWFTNGVADTTAGTNSTYPWTVTAGQTGFTFQCIVTNVSGSATSVVATLSTILTVPAGAGNGLFQANLLGLNPVAYWPLQETAQPPLAQIETNYGSLGSIADAYYSSTNAAAGAPGATGDGDQAVNFKGGLAGSFLAVPQSKGVAVPAGAFSVEAWVYATNITASPNIIIAQTGVPGSGGLNGTANSAGWALVQDYIPSTQSKLFEGWSFHVFNGQGASGGAEVSVPAVITLDNWYHIVGVYDGTNAYLYIDGTNASPQGDQIPMIGSYVPDSWNQMSIGGLAAAGADADRYYGTLDEMAVYTNALTPTQIANHYSQAGNGTYSGTILGDHPYMYWRMDAPIWAQPDNGTYPLAINYGSAANMNGFYLAGNIPGVSGPTNSGLGSSSVGCSINGIGTSSSTNITVFIPNTYGDVTVPGIVTTLCSGILCTNEAPQLCITNQPFTLAAWFRGNPTDNRFQNVVGMHGDLGPRFAMSGGQLQFYVGSAGNLASGTFPNCNDGNWHFGVGVYTNSGSAASGISSLYVDGILVNTQVVTSGLPPDTNYAIMLGADPERILSGNGNSYNERFLSGGIAHIAYFTNALTAAQIVNLYTNATAGVPPVELGLPPTITGQPFPTPPDVRPVGGGTGQYVFEAVAASGLGTLGYQWYFNTVSNYSGTAIINDNVNYYVAQTAQITISNLNTGETGFYYCIVTNAYGSATSVIVNLQVYVSPDITAQSPSGAFSLYPNQTTTLSVTAVGATNKFTYQWFTNNGSGFVGDAAAGTIASYSVTAGAPAISGETYECIVTNSFGSATSLVDTLAISPFPAGLTNAAYSSNILVLKPTDYWPMHETEATAPGDIETNYGSLGALGNGFYADWDGNPSDNPSNSLVAHGFTGALAGDTNTCVSFMGQSNACLVVPHLSPLLTIQPPFTLEAWVKPYGAQPKSFGVFIGQGGGAGLNGGTNDGGFSFLWNGSPQTFSLTLFNGVGAGNSEPKTIANYNPGQWYHMAATYDGTNATIYINGQPASLQNGSLGSMVPDSWSPLLIGAGRWSTLGPQDPFAGTMDEVAIYTNVLTSDRILQHYNAGSSPGSYGTYFTNVLADNPLLYYRMDSPVYNLPVQSTWAVVTNYGTVGLNGVYRPGVAPGGAAGPSPSGLAGTNAMQGNGMGGYVDAGSASALSANPATNNVSFSYTAWFRGHPGEPLGFQGVMSANDGTWRCSINGTGKLQVHGQGGDIVSTLTYNDGNWHQIVLTCVETNTTTHTLNTNNLYVDGLLVGTLVAGGGNLPALYPGPEVYIGNEIGFTNGPMGPERCFSADICEAAFFSGVVLSSNQVVNLYNSAGEAPYINTQPVSGTVNGNLAFTNTVIAGGVAPLSYQWFENGVALSNGGNLGGAVSNGVSTENLIINPVGVGNEGSYYVVVTNNFGSVTSIVANLNVLTNPVISVQYPVPYTNLYTVFSNANPNFSVSAIGAVPLTYYWITNGVLDVAVLAATNLTLTTVQVSFTNYCVISNSFGTVTSMVWSAQVIPDPTNSTGGLAPYPQSVLSLNPVGYWRMDDTNEDGPDDVNGGATFLGGGDFGWVCHDYISGNDGLFTNCSLGWAGYNPVSDPADSSAQFGEADNLGSDFGDSLAFGIQNTSFASPAGANVTFTIEAWVQGYTQTSDAGIVSLGWGGGGEQYNLDCGSDSGTVHRFRFFFRDASGGTHDVNSTVNPSPQGGLGPWYHLAAVVDEVNSNETLYIDGQSVGSTSLGTNNLGVLPATRQMGIGSRQGSATTNYNFQFLGNINDVALFNYALSSNQVLNEYLVSGVAPFMAQQPTANTNASGNGLMVIPAVPYGTGPLTEWWSDVSAQTNILTFTTNGSILNAGLTVSNVPGGWNNDQLELTVSNSYGGTNVLVSLTIFTNAPQITIGIPPQVNLAVNQSYTYSALALGAVPLVYQWYSNNVAITGATNTTFTPVVSGPSQTAYNLVVTNIYGSATALSTLTVFAAPTNGYAAYLLGLAPVGYWPLQETNPPAPVTMETNYGSLGGLGNAYYAITTANQTNVLFNESGALTSSGDNDDSVQFGGPSGTNFAFVPRLSPALTMQAPMTYEAWINSAGSTTFCDVMGEGGNGEDSAAGGGTFAGIRMSYAGNNGGGPALQAYVYNATGNNTYTTIGTPANSLPLNSGWHHCVMTYNGTTVVLYIDGVQQGSGNASLNVDTWSPLTIGDARWQGSGSGPTRPYYGQVDDVAVYTNVLSAARVLAHYQAGTTSSGSNYVAAVTNDNPLLYYRMDCSGFTNVAKSLCPAAVNFGTAPTNGTYVSGTAPGEVSGPPIVTLGNNVASPINGVTACIDAGYNSAFNPTNQFTALGWFKTDPSDARYQDFMSHGNNWALFLSTNGFIRWTNSAGSVTSTGILNDGNWHFMAGVYDGINNYLYVDGALNNKAAASGAISSDTSDDLYLGGSALYTAVGVNQAYFAGAIAQAAFFTNALSAAQIQELYYLATVPAGLRVGLGPTNVTLYAGQSVTLNAQATGTEPFSYQWYQGASPIANATNASYMVTATLGSASYYCTVTNAFNGYSSTNAGPVMLNGIIGPTTTYQATVMGNHPIAYWRLNEVPDNGSGNDGTIAWDYAGGHNGAYENVQLGLPGFTTASMNNTDTAALFGPSNIVKAASNSYVGELYNDGMTPINFAQPSGSNGELSVEVWMKSTNNAQINGAGIVAKGYGNGGEQFDLDLYGNAFRFFVRDAAGGVHGPTSTVSPTIGQWYHVVGVFDGANGAAHIYVNGVDVADTTGIANGLGLLTASTTNTALPQAAYVSIGARASGQTVNNDDFQFQGAIDDVALYNYALTPAQVAADYQAGVQSGVPSFTNAPPIAFSLMNKNQLVLSWPSNYAGYYYLEVQTNGLATGISNNWYPVGGSSAATLNLNTWTNSINPTNGCVFYRLITNGP